MKNQIEQLDILFGCCGESGRSKELPQSGENSLFEPLKRQRGTNAQSDTANALTRQIIRFIRHNGGQAERIAIMGRPQQKGGRVQWVRSYMTVGTADISATIQGRSVKIEVKIGNDRQSDAQRCYQQDVERAGGIYYIARNFKSFVEWYNTTFK